MQRQSYFGQERFFFLLKRIMYRKELELGSLSFLNQFSDCFNTREKGNPTYFRFLFLPNPKTSNSNIYFKHFDKRNVYLGNIILVLKQCSSNFNYIFCLKLMFQVRMLWEVKVIHVIPLLLIYTTDPQTHVFEGLCLYTTFYRIHESHLQNGTNPIPL